MFSKDSDLRWYALQVKSTKEKRVAQALTEKGYECFLPLHESRRAWSDRIKVASVPLFTGYVFCRFNIQTRFPVLITPNVLFVVGTGKVPEPICDGELEAIGAALKCGYPFEPCNGLQEGDHVRVIAGSLNGIEGSLVRQRGLSRLILSVSLIQMSIIVEIDKAFVEPVSRHASGYSDRLRAHTYA